MAHTPGPWVTDGYDVVTAWFDHSGDVDEPPQIHHHTIVHDCNYAGWVDPDVPLANARLIAAAPDMRDALTKALPCLSQPLDDADHGSHATAFRAVRAALAKAGAA